MRYSVPDGRRLTAPVTFPTRTDARRFLATIEADLARGVWFDDSAGAVPLQDFAWSWLAANVRIGPRTREIYAGQLRLHVLPQIDPGVPALGSVLT